MEMFKVCEKETKTKAYSKEGLARAAEMSPEEQAKADAQEVSLCSLVECGVCTEKMLGCRSVYFPLLNAARRAKTHAQASTLLSLRKLACLPC